jgi:hypothetical protein
LIFKARKPAGTMRRPTKIILAVVGAAVAWQFAQIGLIAMQAQYFANGRPYCIKVSSGRSEQYRPVVSLLELNGFNLRAPYVDTSGSMGLTQWTFHALLAVDTGSTPEWRNWSYLSQHFDQLTAQQAKAARLYSVDCNPQADFVLKLPLLAKQ